MDDVADLVRSFGLETNSLGLALIVCGAAFVCSGLVFLLPVGGTAGARERSFEDNIEEIDGHLVQMQNERRYR